MNHQGKTVVIVTHDIEFVAECEPRVILMSDGRIVADGSARNVLTNPDLIAKSWLLLPEITSVLLNLNNLGFPANVMDVYEARDLIIERLGWDRK
jgi:energy-coupling factor transport system ATP-binding protein